MGLNRLFALSKTEKKSQFLPRKWNREIILNISLLLYLSVHLWSPAQKYCLVSTDYKYVYLYANIPSKTNIQATH